MKSYCSIESHSTFSTLDGFPQPDKYFQRAKEVGIEGVAITDHASLAAVVDVQKASEKFGIKGITGIEINVAKPDVDGERTRGYSHLLIYPQNEIGWKNLLYLNYISTTPERFYYKARIFKEDLFAHSEGLVVSSNCIGSVVPREIFSDVNMAARSNSYQEASQYIDSDWEQKTKKTIEEYKSVFKDNFYIGASVHNLVAQKLQRDIVRNLCKKYGVKFAADCDSHFAYPEDSRWQEALVCISTGKTIHQREKLRQDGADMLFGDNSQYYLYSPQEMLQHFTQEELDTTYEIFGKCNLKIERRPPQIPQIHGDPNNLLKSLCESQLIKRGLDDDNRYKDQLKEELSLYIEFNLSGYMLLIKDIFDEAKKLNILITARGSVGGSLVAYLLDIVPLDPIKYGLLFVRFLNRGRMRKDKISLPDVDMDIDSEKRDLLIDRIKEKFGHDKVARLATFGYLGPKGAIKDAFRITASYDDREKYLSVAEAISKHIPNKMQGAPEVTIKSVLEHSETVRGYQEKYPEQFELAEHLEGVIRNNSVHAAGLVIGTQPLVELAPIHYSKTMDSLVTNVEMNDAEFFGLVKVDALGLRNLSTHRLANELYQQLYDKDNTNYFDVRTLPLDGKEADKTWNLAGTGEVSATFQLDSYLGKKYSKLIKPKSIAEVANIGSIVRPGVLDYKLESGISIAESFARRHSGKEDVVPIHKKLKECLQHTHGYWIYQEDLCKAVTILTGWTLSEADLLREACAKKLVDKMAALKQKFLGDCQSYSKLSLEESTILFDIIEKSQRYLFNKSHATLYAATSYVDLFMKANYPLIFYTANLRLAHEGSDKWDTTRDLIIDARKFGIDFLPPSLENTNETFSIVDDKIRIGFANLRGLGKEHQKIVRKIKTIKDWNIFLIRALGIREEDEDTVNKKVVETLIKSGCLDFMGKSRDRMLFEYGLLRNLTKREFRFIENQIKDNPEFSLKKLLKDLVDSDVPNKNRVEKITKLTENDKLDLYKFLPTERAAFWEKECIGTAITCKYTDNYDVDECNCDCVTFYTNDEQNGIKIPGMIEDFTIVMDRKDNQMARFMLCDGYNNVSCIVFSNTYKELGSILKDTEMVICDGYRSKNDDSLIVNKVRLLS